MFLFLTAMLVGFLLLVWSADKFVDGASATAKHLGMPTLLIGVIIVGFGTSAPEMVVSATAAWDGNPSLALGNAIGSNIVNIALILGVTAIITPISVHSKVVRKEIPLLLGIILLSGYFLIDNTLTFIEGVILLVGFFSLIGWSVFSALQEKKDNFANEIEEELSAHPMSLQMGIIWLIAGLVILVGSSKILVWGAVGIATEFGVSDLIIGLTIVALGTSLPELAASIVAVKKGEDDIAIGNVVGSNMFNILAVIGIATVINPMSSISPEVLNRDWIVMLLLTIALFAMVYSSKGNMKSITRAQGIFFLFCYVGYNSYLGVLLAG